MNDRRRREEEIPDDMQWVPVEYHILDYFTRIAEYNQQGNISEMCFAKMRRASNLCRYAILSVRRNTLLGKRNDFDYYVFLLWKHDHWCQ